MSNQSNYQMPMFGAVGVPVRTCPEPDDVQAWLERGADSGLNSTDLFGRVSQQLSFLKTSMVFSRQIEAETLLSSLQDLPDGYRAFLLAAGNPAGQCEDSPDTTMPSTGCWTLNTGVSYSAAVVSSLSQTLQPSEEVAPRYYLSARAARGILNRALKRGKTLPERLQVALERVASLTR